MDAIFSQCFLIPHPSLTENGLADQHSKVHMITGGYSGIGFELAKILYARNATVFIAGRDVTKAKKAMQQIKAMHPQSQGQLEFLFLDLADLSSIKGSVEDFAHRADRLDVLANNAGVMVPPAGSRTAQGHEMQMGVNCLGPYLLTQLLMPIICKTVQSSPAGSVRILWTSSIAVEMSSSIPSGFPSKVTNDQALNYGLSKVGNILLAAETARRYGNEAGVVSVALNPGNMKTLLQRNMVWWQYAIARMLLYPAKLGAYTQLFAGWSDAISLENNGAYVWPWGRFGSIPEYVSQAIKSPDQDGSAVSERFWAWCEEMVSGYR